jgi:hypothetical protein
VPEQDAHWDILPSIAAGSWGNPGLPHAGPVSTRCCHRFLADRSPGSRRLGDRRRRVGELLDQRELAGPLIERPAVDHAALNDLLRDSGELPAEAEPGLWTRIETFVFDRSD